MRKYIFVFIIGVAIGILGGILLDSKFLQSNSKENTSQETVTRVEEEEEDNPKSEEKTEKTKMTTPVEEHGQLKVDGNKIVDKNGQAFQLKGMSTHGIQWFGEFVNKDGFKTLRDDWNTNCVRIAMYTDNNSGYPQKKEELKKLVKEGIKNCIDLGLYVIVDWHILDDSNPNMHRDEAITFFREMAAEYKAYPNMLYELCNEPNGNVTWDNDIKPYCEQVTREIRTQDDDAIVIAGTPRWSQQIDLAAKNRLTDKNTVYALHFYANTHKDELRNTLISCVKDKNLPILVTEFGTCDASGNGGVNLKETKTWLNLLDENKIGYMNWNLANKDEASSCFKPGTSAQGNWEDKDLTQGGKFIKDWFKLNK